MPNVRQPIVVNRKTLAENSPVEPEAHKILYIGRVLESSNVTDRSLYTNVTDEVFWKNLLNSKSEAYKNLKLAKSISTRNRIDLIPIKDDNSGTQATATITCLKGQTALFGGTLTFRCISRALNSYSINVTKGDDIETILRTLVSKINNDEFAGVSAVLGVDAGDTSHVITLTTSHKGAFCNNYVMELINMESLGFSYTMTSFTGGTDGANFVDITNSIFDQVSKIRYQEIVIDGISSSYYDLLENFLSKRWNVANQIKDGHGWMVMRDTFSNLLSFAQSKNGFNVSVFYDKIEDTSDYKGAYLGETEGAIALTMAQIEALQYLEGADLSSLYPSLTGLADLEGGVRQATIPYFNTLIPWMIPLRNDLGFSDELQDNMDEYSSEVGKLRNEGFCEIGNNANDTGVLRGECRTFFKTDIFGNKNTTYKFVNTKWTASKFSEYLYLRQKQLYPKNRLSDSAGQYDQTVTRESFIKDLKNIYIECSSPEEGRLLLRDSVAAFQLFSDIVEESLTLDFASGEITDKQLLAFNSQVRSIVNTLTPVFNI